MENKQKFLGMNILITGGAQRIGAAIVKMLAQHGANVIIHCNKSIEKAEQLLCCLSSGDHRIIVGDLRNYVALVNQLDSLNINVDILINNAAIFNVQNIVEESDSDIKDQMNINFFAPYALMRWFYKQKTLTKGCIINFLDQRNVKADPYTGSYAISKKALEQATLTGALQFAPKVRVNGIAPGPVLPPNDYQGIGFERALKNVPMQKKVELESITRSVEFLIECEAITGQILYVDGGEHLS